ncbi:class I SAM-dependent methyltransferase [Lysobacter sp. CA199]|uniref:class I SAM-dependent methyltransferase n=1 Tax=Lysobacter sp. CA199 TaxID=3455608 RepID=UPI003F8D1100
MTQNIYDDDAFFEGYSQLPRSRRGLDGAPEWPTLQALLPSMTGLRVADLGCGYGWFCRLASEQGAARVLGLDVSAKMLERAQSQPRSGVSYARADLEAVSLPSVSFELIYSSLTLHYIENLAGLLRNARGALVPGGRLVFSIEHPIYMAPSRPAWIDGADGRRCWPLNDYQREGERITDWLAPGVRKQHRTLGTLLNLLIDTGLMLDRVIEWGPSPQQLQDQPALAEETDRPMLLLVAAHR